MTAFNTVRFNLKPGREQEFLDAHQKAERNWPGLRHANLIRTGDQSYCIIGEWDDMDSLAAARPFMLMMATSVKASPFRLQSTISSGLATAG